MDRVAAMTTFVKVVEAGSLSTAARSLDLSLPSVSRQLDGLEEHLRTRLLVRTTRHLALTEGGRIYYDQAKRILAAIEEAETTLSAQHATPSGHLIVSAPVLFGRLHLAPLLPEFLERYPKLSVELLLFDRVANLVEEGIDVAIRPGHSKIHPHRPQARGLPPRCLRRPLLPRAPRRTNEASGLENHDCIVFTLLDSAQEWCFRTEAGDINVPVSGWLPTNNHDATVTAALGGAGFVLGPSWMVRDHILAGRLIPVLQGFEPPAIEVHALFPHLRLMPAKVRAFTDFLVERCVIEELGRPLPT